MGREGDYLVFEGVGRGLRPVRARVPAPGPGEILVRVRACAWCGSDLHTTSGRRPSPGAHIPGHEIVGEIIEMGEGVSGVDGVGRGMGEGSRVTWTLHASCGECFYCRRGLRQKCLGLFKYGHTALASGGEWSGGMAEWCLLRAGTGVYVLPEGVTDGVAVVANCSAATGSAALRVGGLEEGESVLVTGGGMLGLMVAAQAVAAGAGRVLVFELHEGRRALASSIPGGRVQAAGDWGEVGEWVRAGHGGEGVDLMVEATGAVGVIGEGLRRLRVGGRLVLLGSVLPGPALELDVEQLTRRCQALHGVHNYGAGDLEVALAYLGGAGGRGLPWGQLVGGPLGLGEAEEALKRAREGEALRVWVAPWG